jgi:hypothetical protein
LATGAYMAPELLLTVAGGFLGKALKSSGKAGGPNSNSLGIDGGPQISSELLEARKAAIIQEKLPRVRFTAETERLMGPAPAGMKNAHKHHILEVNGRAGEHRSLVREGQEILRSYKIDPLQGVENLVWAPNKGHKIAPAQNLLDDLRGAQQFGLGRDDIVEILNDHGQRAAGR